MKVLFLDCDGVLNSHTGMLFEYDRTRRMVFRWLEPRLVSLFSSWMNAHPDINIVMSSSWRNWYNSMPELRQDMQNRGIKIAPNRWIDRTPYFPGEHRGVEIQFWLHEHAEVTHIAILDDDSDMDEVSPYLVKTNADTGVTGADLLRVKETMLSPLAFAALDWSKYQPRECILRSIMR